jgi:hypothetical protein
MSPGNVRKCLHSVTKVSARFRHESVSGADKANVAARRMLEDSNICDNLYELVRRLAKSEDTCVIDR